MRIGLGRTALMLGHVTFSISFILVIVRGRLVSIGTEFETAAQDLGATRMQAIRTVLLPMLVPAIFAAAMITFAASLDDFVVSNFLYGDASQHHCSGPAVQRRQGGPVTGTQRAGDDSC